MPPPPKSDSGRGNLKPIPEWFWPVQAGTLVNVAPCEGRRTKQIARRVTLAADGIQHSGLQETREGAEQRVQILSSHVHSFCSILSQMCSSGLT